MLLYKIIDSNLHMLTQNTPPRLLDRVRAGFASSTTARVGPISAA